MTHPHPYLTENHAAAEAAMKMYGNPITREEDPGLAAMRAASARYTRNIQTTPQTAPEKAKEIAKAPPPPTPPLDNAMASAVLANQFGVTKSPKVRPRPRGGPTVGGVIEDVIGGILGEGLLQGIPFEEEIFAPLNPKKPAKKKPKPKKPAAGKHKVRRCLLVTRSTRTKADCTKGGKATIPLEGKPGTVVKPGRARDTGRTAGRVNRPPETPRKPLKPKKPKKPVLKPGKVPVPGHDDLRFIWNGRFWNCWSAKTKRFVKCPPGVKKPAKLR